MRALLLSLVLFGTFALAVLGQNRWTARLAREQRMALGRPPEGWSTLVIGRPSGAEPLDYPERGWASPEGRDAAPDEDAAGTAPALAAEAEPHAPSTEPQYAPDFVYRVQRGDTLGGICQGHYGTARKSLVEAVAAYNELPSANAIREGELIYLPDAARF